MVQRKSFLAVLGILLTILLLAFIFGYTKLNLPWHMSR